jgi:hypothetical protein
MSSISLPIYYPYLGDNQYVKGLYRFSQKIIGDSSEKRPEAAGLISARKWPDLGTLPQKTGILFRIFSPIIDGSCFSAKA